MTALAMELAMLPPAGRTLFAEMAAKRKARGAGFGGPYIALLNHPDLARRIEELGFFLKFDSVLPRPAYQFIVLSVAQATGAAFEWHDHVQHALAAGLSQDIIDSIGTTTGA
jgi:4-carboxymuconolactone decarboxylase